MSAVPAAEPQLPPLRLEPALSAPPALPVRPPAAGNQRGAHPWQFLGTTPEEAAQTQLELERQDRAMVALRKQVHAARQGVGAAAGADHSAAAVWGAGALAAVAGFGWLLERRRRLAQQDPPLSVQGLTVMPPEPVGFPPAVEPTGVSDFDAFETTGPQDDADLWIRRAGVALPEPSLRRVAQ